MRKTEKKWGFQKDVEANLNEQSMARDEGILTIK